MNQDKESRQGSNKEIVALCRGIFIMTIEIKEKGSQACYKEVVNVIAQYRYILKNHDYKLKDYFRQFMILIILAVIVLLLLILTMVLWGVNSFDIAGVFILAAIFIQEKHILSGIKKLLHHI